MKRFLAIFLASSTSPRVTEWEALDPEAKKEREREGMEAWMQWGSEHETAIRDVGAPLGKTKRVSNAGIADTKNELTAYCIVEAETHEDAAKLFEEHPHFSIFPGDSIEIMECLPMPKM
jgi:hypothetical protein